MPGSRRLRQVSNQEDPKLQSADIEWPDTIQLTEAAISFGDHVVVNARCLGARAVLDKVARVVRPIHLMRRAGDGIQVVEQRFEPLHHRVYGVTHLEPSLRVDEVPILR